MKALYLLALIPIALCVAGGVYVLNAADNADAAARARSLEACERGNPLREVVFKNTTNAIVENKHRPAIRQVFEQNLGLLLSVEHGDPKTGRVDCEAAVD